VHGADAVMHLAASVRGARAADFDEPNVAGTGRLLDALERHAGDAPLLLLSSLAAREPALSHYAASKQRAEREVLARAAGRRCLVLRPPAVYGPGDREMLPVFRFMARSGLAPCAGSPAQRLSLVHVDDLVAALLAWLPGCPAAPAPVSLDDGRPGGYDWHELAAIAAAVCGRGVRVWQVPRPLLDAVAAVNVRLSPLFGHAPMLTPGKLRELRHPDWSAEGDATPLLCGWQPRLGLAEGLLATPGWF